jgi:uncharacterized membrane protein
MEFFSLLVLLTILIIVFSLRSSIQSNYRNLEGKIDNLAEELARLRRENKITTSEEEKRSRYETFLAKPTPQVIKEEKLPEPPAKPESKIVPVTIDEEKLEKEALASVSTSTPPESVKVPLKMEPLPPKKPGFFERNPDLEKFIGENLANKIGIGILVIGIGFFVKYAIDKDWINEVGRVFIGVLCSGILLGVAHRMRKTFTSFSSVLVGGGIAILYLTIAIGFHEYKLFSQTAAFFLMIVITAFTVVLSLGYNRIELAILGILGGFGSPFMVSTGEGNYIVLFTYILILDVGMLALAYFKKWSVVTIIAFALTLILFGSWVSTGLKTDSVPMIRGALFFATMFYFVFFGMNIINNLKEKIPFKALEFSLLLSNTFFYYGMGMYILSDEISQPFRGLFTVSLAVFNFIFAYSLFRSPKADKNLVYLMIGLVLTFVSLAAPIQLHGNYITLFWSAEGVLLLWLSQKSGIKLMKIASYVVMALMLMSLTIDWGQIYGSTTNENLSIIFNKGYITGLFALASLGLTFYFLKNETDSDILNVNAYKIGITIVGVFVLYLTNLLELRYHLANSSVRWALQTVIVGIYNLSFLLALLSAERRLSLPQAIRPLFVFWGLLAMVSHFFIYQGAIIDLRGLYLTHTIGFGGLATHYIFLALMVMISVLTIRRFRLLKEFNENTFQGYAWLYVAFFLFLASAELDTTVLLIASPEADHVSDLLKQNHKIGFPILWGIASFILIFVGLNRKNKTLRIISLSLFLLTLLKLFLVDIRGISEGGKIAAFISLGILLLIVSFMYQRLKKLLLTDEGADAEPKPNDQ